MGSRYGIVGSTVGSTVGSSVGRRYGSGHCTVCCRMIHYLPTVPVHRAIRHRKEGIEYCKDLGHDENHETVLYSTVRYRTVGAVAPWWRPRSTSPLHS